MGLRIERFDQNDGSIQLKVTVDKSVPKGPHAVECRLGPDAGKGDWVRFLINVVD
jgi:hypothetical protein